MQAQQVANQLTMQAKDWWYLLITAAATLLAAFGAAGFTLWRQHEGQKHAAKLNLFLTLMMHRKADPPNQAWVNALNIIDVIFHDSGKVIQSWHRLYAILNDEAQVGTEAHRHEYINMLSEMALALDYPELKQIDIDKFYSPKIYAQQAQMNAQMQGELMSLFRSIGAIVSQKEGQKPKQGTPAMMVEIAAPEDNTRVFHKQDVTGFVIPEGANVQVLVFSPNNLWYPQGPILRERAKWKVKAHFGDEKSSGQSFKLIAIVSATDVKEPVKELPADAVRSEVVIVTRTLVPPPVGSGA